MIKGHVKIDIHNRITGRYERTERDNLVTNALANVLGLASHACAQNANQVMDLLPAATKGLGGILLFDGTLTEDVSNIHFPMGVHLTGSAGQTTNTASKITGSINTAESGRTDTGYVNVWDFSTSQANGTIASLALTHKGGGARPTEGCQYYNGGQYQMSLYYSAVGYDESTRTEYLYYQGKVYKKQTYSEIIRAYSPYLGADEQVFDFAFTDPAYTGWEVCPAYDGYIYAVRVPQISTKGTITVKIRKLKISDGTLTEEAMQTIAITDVTASGTGDTYCTNNHFAVVSDGHLYFMSYDRNILYKVDISNTADVKAITVDGCKILYVFPMRGGGVMATIYWQGTSSSGASTTYYNKAIIYPDDKCRYDNSILYTGSGNLSEVMNYETDGLMRPYKYNSYSYYAFAANYLGTICNLDSPVIKTSAQSMKITYTLTDVA